VGFIAGILTTKYRKVKHQKVLQVISPNGKVGDMDKLIAYLNNLPPDEREAFAKRCGTTIGYLRKAASISQQLSEGLCLRIGAESSGNVPLEHLRPDVDWQYMRAALANTAPQAIEAISGRGACRA
jgi:DNA-binding transcriptional regulator YdaS (Cro superfamily)